MRTKLNIAKLTKEDFAMRQKEDCKEQEGMTSLTLTEINSQNIREAISYAKKDALKHDGDFAEASGQILVLDNDGERMSDGDPADYFDGIPSLKTIRKIFNDFPDCKQLEVEGQTRYYAEYGNIATQRAEATPCDWWTVSIYRDSKPS